MDDEAKAALDRLFEAVKYDEIHYRDCETAGPIPFPCDCTASDDVAKAIALIVSISDA